MSDAIVDGESREVRPYTGLDGIEDVFEAITLKVGETVTDSSIPLDIGEFFTSEVRLIFASGKKEFLNFKETIDKAIKDFNKRTQGDINNENLEFMILLKSVGKNKAIPLTRCSLKDFEKNFSREHVIIERDMDRASLPGRVMCDPNSTFHISVILHLDKKIKRHPLTPFRKGTWLAEKTFTLRGLRESLNVFRPLPLTKEIRERLELPSDVVYFSELQDPLNPEEHGDSMIFYVDEDLFETMKSNPSTEGSVIYQTELAISNIKTLFEKAADVLRDESEIYGSVADIKGSIMDTLLDHLAQDGEKNRVDKKIKEEYFTQLKTSPEKVIALIEGRTYGERSNKHKKAWKNSMNPGD